MFRFHWWLTIHQWTEFSISNSTYVQISCVKYIPLLCWIWPTFKQKSSLFYQQSLGMIQTRIPIHNFPWWQDQSYSSANYIHCSAKLSVTFHHFANHLKHCSSFVQFSSEAELQIFFLEGRHLSKIWLGANVTEREKLILLSFVWCRVLSLSSSISSSCYCGN